MKISKLFHWLYAFVMFLPVFFVLGRSLYTIFNENAKDSYSGNVEYTETIATPVFQTNEISSVEDLVVGNYYLFQFTTEYTNESDSIPLLEDIGIDGFYFTFLDINGGIEQYSLQHNGLYLDYLEIKTKVDNDNDNAIFIGDDFQDTYELQLFTALHSGGTCNTRFLVHYTDYIDPLTYDITHFVDFLSILPNSYQQYIISENVVEVSTLDNAFEYSMNQLNEVSLFSWAKTSFLVAPFNYISGLFGIQVNNPVNTLLSYWLAISIIWLVFDLVLYVPLLVHRWLDKGVVE